MFTMWQNSKLVFEEAMKLQGVACKGKRKQKMAFMLAY